MNKECVVGLGAYLIFSIFSTTQTTRTRGFGERKSVGRGRVSSAYVWRQKVGESYQDDVYSLLQVELTGRCLNQ